MSEFNEKIKEPTDEEKCKVYKEILQRAINYGTIIEEQKLLKEIAFSKISLLSEDEINAILVLATEMNKYSIFRSGYFDDMVPEKKRMVEFLCNDSNFDDKNVITFVNAITNDMRKCRKYTLTNGKWEFHIRRIFQFIDGKNPYKIYDDLETEINEKEKSKSNLKLIIGGKYDR